MKKLFLSMMLVAFAVSVSAGETNQGSSCCAKKKDSTEAKAQCCPAGKKAKGQCPSCAKKTAAKINSPKDQAKN